MSTPHARVIASNEYRRERWRNGLGWTREICRIAIAAPTIEPDIDDPWDVRLSIAEIERDAAFSIFPGIDRELVLLSGSGLALDFDDGECTRIDPPHGRHRFTGERAVTGRLLDGRTVDFNLMWRRDTCVATLWHRPLVGPMVVFGSPSTFWCVHVISGHARSDDGTLPPLHQGDTLILAAGDARMRHVLEGAGEALVIRVEPVSNGASPDLQVTIE